MYMQHKLTKYLYKLSNTDINSDKFKIYLNKVNYYYEQYGGKTSNEFKNELDIQKKKLTDVIIEKDAGKNSVAKQTALFSNFDGNLSNRDIQNLCVANYKRNYDCEDQIEKKMKEYNKNIKSISSTIVKQITNEKQIDNLTNICSDINGTAYVNQKTACCNNCGKKYIALTNDQNLAKRYVNIGNEETYWDADKTIGNICGCSSVHMSK